MNHTIIPPVQDIPLYLSGAKTAFWLPCKIQPNGINPQLRTIKFSSNAPLIGKVFWQSEDHYESYPFPLPYAIGQRIAVREKVYELGTHGRTFSETGCNDYIFRSNYKFVYEKPNDENYRVISAGAMPPAATRMWLTVQDRQVKRVQDVTPREIRSLAIAKFGCVTHILNLREAITAKCGAEFLSNNEYIFLYNVKTETK